MPKKAKTTAAKAKGASFKPDAAVLRISKPETFAASWAGAEKVLAQGETLLLVHAKAAVYIAARYTNTEPMQLMLQSLTRMGRQTKQLADWFRLHGPVSIRSETKDKDGAPIKDDNGKPTVRHSVRMDGDKQDAAQAMAINKPDTFWKGIAKAENFLDAQRRANVRAFEYSLAGQLNSLERGRRNAETRAKTDKKATVEMPASLRKAWLAFCQDNGITGETARAN